MPGPASRRQAEHRAPRGEEPVDDDQEPSEQCDEEEPDVPEQEPEHDPEPAPEQEPLGEEPLAAAGGAPGDPSNDDDDPDGPSNPVAPLPPMPRRGAPAPRRQPAPRPRTIPCSDIEKMVDAICDMSKSEGIKYRTPDQFNGTDPSKLRPSSCSVHSISSPSLSLSGTMRSAFYS